MLMVVQIVMGTMMDMLQSLAKLERLNLYGGYPCTDKELIRLSSSLTKLQHLKVCQLFITVFPLMQDYMELWHIHNDYSKCVSKVSYFPMQTMQEVLATIIYAAPKAQNGSAVPLTTTHQRDKDKLSAQIELSKKATSDGIRALAGLSDLQACSFDCSQASDSALEAMSTLTGLTHAEVRFFSLL